MNLTQTLDAGQTRVRARWILPVVSPPLKDAVITMSRGRIDGINQACHERIDHDLGEVMILPRLVNAHTHLEFSDLEHPIGRQGMSLTDWIRLVVQRRAESELGQHQVNAIQLGLTESVRFGTGAIGEIATQAWATNQAEPPISMSVFFECLGNHAQNVDEALTRTTAAIHALPPGDRLKPGISPHAPYSVHPWLFENLVRLAKQLSLPIAMHLAESREELQWLDSASGPFRGLLDDLQAINADVMQPRRRPLDYLRPLAEARRSLIIHGNYLDAEELDFVAKNSSALHVVYCPRTHRFFEHEPYPLRQMLELGICVAVGTDSRASTPDLNVWRELRCIRQQHPDVTPESILRMGTLNGALALGELNAGQLRVGGAAEFSVLPVPYGGSDPYEAVLEVDGEPSAWPVPPGP